MPLDLQRYSDLRPFLYHITYKSNLPSIRTDQILHTVASLAPDIAGVRRAHSETRRRGQHNFTLRDQATRHLNNTASPSNYDLILDLSSRVFFWPGDEEGPSKYGKRMLGAYALEEQVMLRVGFEDLCQINPDAPPHFCRFNSGAPRKNNGQPSPRGPDTFLTADDWHEPRSMVIEVSFQDNVRLPPTCQVLEGTSWQQLQN